MSNAVVRISIDRRQRSFLPRSRGLAQPFASNHLRGGGLPLSLLVLERQGGDVRPTARNPSALDPAVSFCSRKLTVSQTATTTVKDPCHLSHCSGIVLSNAPHDAVEVVGSRCCPAQAH